MRLDTLCAAVPRVLGMMIVSCDSIIALSLRCEPAACCVELGEGWYGSLVMARHGRKAVELAYCASRITLPRYLSYPLCLSRRLSQVAARRQL